MLLESGTWVRVYGAGVRAGEVARRAGVNAATLRYYERRGLLPAPARLTNAPPLPGHSCRVHPGGRGSQAARCRALSPNSTARSTASAAASWGGFTRPATSRLSSSMTAVTARA